MNGEPVGFVKFIGQLEMTSFGAFVSQILWFVGSLTFTGLVWWLATHDKAYVELAIALLAAWTGKSITNAAANFGVRKTAREYVEAKARGEASARPAVVAEKVERVEVAPRTAPAGMPVEVEHEWASGDPRAGVL